MRSLPCRMLVMPALLLSAGSSAPAQMVLSGRVQSPRYAGSSEVFHFTASPVFATRTGSGRQSIAFRTWETDPSGWYRLSGPAGNYTLAFTGPGRFMRPLLLTNQYLGDGDTLVRHVSPRADYAMMSPQAWDNKPATDYYQTFVASSTSITHVGFKLAHDGVDGEGPGAQNLLVSIHRGGAGAPDTWEQVGPAMPVLGVNAGGGLDIAWAAGWHSGEVPVEPGKTYAVRLRAEKPGGAFQCFWRQDAVPNADCFRVGADGKGYTGRNMWLYVAGDGDGLLLACNKRVQREFHQLTRFGRKWSQTYVAQGRSLASAMFYAAVAVEQKSLNLQRVVVRVREGGLDGPVTGIEKLGIGQTTATAESGLFGVVAAPGEIPLVPGKTYAIEFESFGQDKGFNPVARQPPDPIERGAAYFDGRTKMDYDLDMIVVEYANSAAGWASAVEEHNHLANGDMQYGDLDPDNRDAGGPEGWKRFAIDKGTAFWYLADDNGNRYVKVLGGSINGRTVDGGYVQRVAGLDRIETYRFAGRVRSSWLVDQEHQVMIGIDPTGQDSDPEAGSIRWLIVPDAVGVFERHTTDPVRPAKDAISVWLRGRTTFIKQHPFEVDFDDWRLCRVRTDAP